MIFCCIAAFFGPDKLPAIEKLWQIVIYSIAGAIVQIKSTTVSVTTGEDGSFSLNVPDNATLVVTLIGYRIKEIVVGTQTTIDIQTVPISNLSIML
ncbi:MAG: carboxypeptidase-like regulatory domain-containing protein [Prevotellaceae bacterium]|nr:carboxypeptidase-like regulatory domain-containing protein [Prevotellaceae bacterium]